MFKKIDFFSRLNALNNWLRILKITIEKASKCKYFEIIELMHRDTNIEGIIISVFETQNLIDLDKLIDDPVTKLHAKTICNLIKVLHEMISTIKQYPFPIERATTLKKVLYFNFASKIKFLEKMFAKFQQEL